MRKLYSSEIKNEFIVYDDDKNAAENVPTIVFVHGLMSSMNSSKARYLMDYCKKKHYRFIVFDNFGHGASSGNFVDQTIGSWLRGLQLVLDKLIKGNKAILVGSSMGGWVALLAALYAPEKVKALVGLATAVDFTEGIWSKLTLKQKQEIKEQGIIKITGNTCNDIYPISYNLIVEAQKHLLLVHDKIELNIPLHLIHGKLDNEVPYEHSLQLMDKITSKQITLKLIKDAEHHLSREVDLEVISNSLDEIIKGYEIKGDAM